MENRQMVGTGRNASAGICSEAPRVAPPMVKARLVRAMLHIVAQENGVAGRSRPRGRIPRFADGINCSHGLTMSDEKQVISEFPHKPIVVRRVPAPIEDLLRHVDPAPDEEIERFVAAIYADRLHAATIRPRA